MHPLSTNQESRPERPLISLAASYIRILRVLYSSFKLQRRPEHPRNEERKLREFGSVPGTVYVWSFFQPSYTLMLETANMEDHLRAIPRGTLKTKTWRMWSTSRPDQHDFDNVVFRDHFVLAQEQALSTCIFDHEYAKLLTIAQTYQEATLEPVSIFVAATSLKAHANSNNLRIKLLRHPVEFSLNVANSTNVSSIPQARRQKSPYSIFSRRLERLVAPCVVRSANFKPWRFHHPTSALVVIGSHLSFPRACWPFRQLFTSI
jgi:hypothetical protein